MRKLERHCNIIFWRLRPLPLVVANNYYGLLLRTIVQEKVKYILNMTRLSPHYLTLPYYCTFTCWCSPIAANMYIIIYYIYIFIYIYIYIHNTDIISVITIFKSSDRRLIENVI